MGEPITNSIGRGFNLISFFRLSKKNFQNRHDHQQRYQIENDVKEIEDEVSKNQPLVISCITQELKYRFQDSTKLGNK